MEGNGLNGIQNQTIILSKFTPTPMKDSLSTGEKGRNAENAALGHLEGQGFKLLIKNYRYKRAEIDLIMGSDELIVFVEVKFRKNTKYGFPEDFVSKNQKERIISAADHYIHESDWQGNIRFDIIAVDADMSITHFEDAFY